MKIVPAIIAVLFGGIFLWLEMGFNYFPPIPTISLADVLEAPEQAKARSAVIAMLRDPSSAAIDDMRTVKSEQAKYVCGLVNAKGQAGQYVGARNFTFEISSGLASIEAGGEIARVHHAFRACPAEKSPEPLVVDLDKLNKIASALPRPNIQIAVPNGNGSSGSPASSQDLRSGIEGLKRNAEQRIGVSAGSSVSGSQVASSSSSSPSENREWQGDRPPKQWPQFPSDDPLSKPGDSNLTDSQALAFAYEVERGWASSPRPSPTDVLRAQRALLTIKEQSPLYPKAWASFVRLQAMRREAST